MKTNKQTGDKYPLKNWNFGSVLTATADLMTVLLCLVILGGDISGYMTNKHQSTLRKEKTMMIECKRTIPVCVLPH